MTLFGNQLTGQIPLSYSVFTSLTLLAMDNNIITGPLTTVYSFENLHTLWLDGNQLTGTIGENIDNLSLLSHLRLQNNLLSHKLPEALGNIVNLEIVELDGNLFTSTIPESVNNMTKLKVLKLSNNMLSGQIPSLNRLVLLEDLALRNNRFSGSISFGLGELQSLEFFDVSNNILYGSLESSNVSSLKNITQFYIQGNMFTGTLENTFYDYNDVKIVYFDASDNLFSGSIPKTIFQFPHISVIALSINCFQGTLPKEICYGSDIHVLSMDGLAAADGCRHSRKMPLTDIVMFNVLDGSIPECIFQDMMSLEFLHLTGNGLAGPLTDLSINSTMKRLQLSHNQLTSTIPTSVQSHAFLQIDLSYNKFTGEYEHPFVDENSSVTISAQVNRLSGHLDVNTLEEASKVKILRGNIFDCHGLPQNDPHVNNYSCGSTTLDDAYYFLSLMSVLVVFSILFIVTIHKRTFSQRKADTDETKSESNEDLQEFLFDFHQNTRLKRVYQILKNVIYYRSYCVRCLAVVDDSSRNIYVYSKELNTFSKYVLLLAGVCMISSVPTFVLRILDYDNIDDNEFEYNTHANIYGWITTVAFVTGEIPALLLVVSWGVSCCVFVLLVNSMLLSHSKNGEGSSFTDRLSSRFSFGNNLRRSNDDDSGVFSIWRLSGTESKMRSSQNERTSEEYSNDVDLTAGVKRPNSICSSTDRQSTSSSTTSSTPLRKRDKLTSRIRQNVISTSIILMIINSSVIIVVNGVYIIYSPDLSSLMAVMFQFALALFNVFYAIFVVPALTVGFANHSDAINVRIILLLINSLLIPCVVTAVSSPSCIQGLFVQPNEVTASYSYSPDCAITGYSHTGESVCTEVNDVYVEVAGLVPPFSYNYQCTSVLLTAYIPVFIYTYSLQVIAPFLFLYALCYLDYNKIPKRWSRMIPGILFPDNWSKDSTSKGFRSDMLKVVSSKRLYNVKTVTSNMIHNIIILMTFGLCSPMLALLIGASSHFIISTWQILIARFVHYRFYQLKRIANNRNLDPGQRDYSLKCMGRLAGEAKGLIRLCLYPYVFFSCFFIGCLAWDMAGDRVGWRKALRLPLLSFILLCVLLITMTVYIKIDKSTSRGLDQNNRNYNDSGNVDVDDDVEMTKIQTMVNPMLQ